MFFKKESSSRATEECKKWGVQWKSVTADLMQDIDEELQGCLHQMILSANRKYANAQNAGYFLGGLKTVVDEEVSDENNSSGWIWHNGRKIEVRINQKILIKILQYFDNNLPQNVELDNL